MLLRNVERQVFMLLSAKCSVGKGLEGLNWAKETTLERAAFWAGWSELSWSGRAQPILA